jgi:serine protease Do
MRRLGCLGLALVWCALPATGMADPAAAFARFEPSIVAVTYYVETSVMREVREVSGRDLGVVVAADLVLLNGSVVTASSTGAEPHDFRVHFAGGEEQGGLLVGRDELANLAFLRLQSPLPAGVKPLRFDARPRLRVGDPLFALGLLPENLEPMLQLLRGTVLAHVERPKDFLLTDLPVELALGGPVFTADGTLAGILSELGDAGPAFASGYATDELHYGLVLDPETVARLIRNPPLKGEVRRSWLGITLQALDHDMADYWGVPAGGGIVVNSVVAGSPAERAGLREGDIVVTLNGGPIPVTREEHVPVFVDQIGSRPVGSSLTLGVVRGKDRFETAVELAAAPKSRLDAVSYASVAFEFTVRELVFQDFRSLDLKPETKGVLVSKVEEGGWAGVGGLDTGDVIQRVDDRAIESPADLQHVLDDAATQRKRKLVFFVLRSGRTQFITVQPNWEGQP